LVNHFQQKSRNQEIYQLKDEEKRKRNGEEEEEEECRPGVNKGQLN
jgi:hypothetical protein